MWKYENSFVLKNWIAARILKTGEQHYYSRRVRRQPERFILTGNDAEENY